MRPRGIEWADVLLLVAVVAMLVMVFGGVE